MTLKTATRLMVIHGDLIRIETELIRLAKDQPKDSDDYIYFQSLLVELRKKRVSHLFDKAKDKFKP